MLNTIPGQCARLVESSGCGLNYTAGGAQSCFEAICRLVDFPARRASMQAAALKLAEKRHARRLVYAEYTRFLERVVRG